MLNYEALDVKHMFAQVDEINPEQSEYLSVLSSTIDASIDFIVNDGKIRDWVAIKSIDKLKAGGVYVLDNAERYIPNEFDIPTSIGINAHRSNLQVAKRQ